MRELVCLQGVSAQRERRPRDTSGTSITTEGGDHSMARTRARFQIVLSALKREYAWVCADREYPLSCEPPHAERSIRQRPLDALAWGASMRGARDAHRVISHGDFLDSVGRDRGDAEASVRARGRALRRAAARAPRGRRPRAPARRGSLSRGQSPRRLDRRGGRKNRQPRVRGHRTGRLDAFSLGVTEITIPGVAFEVCGTSRRFRRTLSASCRRSAAALGSWLRAG